ncbi:hypothetical protein [Dactylosporangium sp. CA-139066]|uniref:hypothetical protein n=1 Tax=Dactylosporangium sp. CA-139066 TaxID=3239930 RepID=UPI003D8DF028
MMPPQAGPHPQFQSPDEVPPPPRGPGVLTPFAAPPRDRDLRGLWIGLGVGGLALVLCCIGGVVGIAFLLPYADNVAKSQIVSVVDVYLGAVRDEDFVTARRQLCDAEQRTHTVAWFEDHFAAAPVTDFRVDAADVRITNNDITVAAQVQQNGRWVDERYDMEQAGSRYVICGGID